MFFILRFDLDVPYNKLCIAASFASKELIMFDPLFLSKVVLYEFFVRISILIPRLLFSTLLAINNKLLWDLWSFRTIPCIIQTICFGQH